MKLYVSYHAPVAGLGPDVFDNPDVIPIQAGANRPGAASLDMLADNTGRHISGRGATFGELCAHYWVWRNRRDADVVGRDRARRRAKRRRTIRHRDHRGHREGVSLRRPAKWKNRHRSPSLCSL